MRETINKEIEKLDEQLQLINDRMKTLKTFVDGNNSEGDLTELFVFLERVVINVDRARFHMGMINQEIKQIAVVS